MMNLVATREFLLLETEAYIIRSCNLCQWSWATAVRECMIQCPDSAHYSTFFVCFWGNGLCVILNDVANWRMVEEQGIPNLCVARSQDPRILEIGDFCRIEDY